MVIGLFKKPFSATHSEALILTRVELRIVSSGKNTAGSNTCPPRKETRGKFLGVAFPTLSPIHEFHFPKKPLKILLLGTKCYQLLGSPNICSIRIANFPWILVSHLHQILYIARCAMLFRSEEHSPRRRSLYCASQFVSRKFFSKRLPRSRVDDPFHGRPLANAPRYKFTFAAPVALHLHLIRFISRRSSAPGPPFPLPFYLTVDTRRA